MKNEKTIKIAPIFFERYSKEKDVLTRRFKKFNRNPKIFVRDSYKKRSSQIMKILPTTNVGVNEFTVVSAIYNVDKYLNDYFRSLVNQTLDFRKHIQLVLVDDGSTDKSAAIIKKWQRKYPNNITYIYKDNGGQASARNLGLNFVKSEWVTFIDPDDFINLSYFKILDDKLIEYPDVKMLVTNLKFYNESQVSVSDRHPLRFRFKNKEPVNVNSLDNNINLSASSTFFKMDYVRTNSIVFSSYVRPNFEDGKFIADYLLDISKEKVMFIKESIYFYRKREDGTSTLDTSWNRKEKFYDVFVHGFIPMLEMYKNELGFVPKNIQKTALYDMSWYIQYLINKPEKISFLSKPERERFYSLFLKVFEYIEESTIMSFGMAGIWFFQKIGMLGAFKGVEPQFDIVYIENIDQDKRQILITSFTYFDKVISYNINQNDVLPSYNKKLRHEFNDATFAYEVRSWIPYTKNNDVIEVLIGNRKARVSLKAKFFNKNLTIEDIIQKFEPSDKYISDDSWLLMDRETKADDNAEHFYRYLMCNYPKQKCYFSLRKDSNDWLRLEQEGFNLIEFGSQEYEYRLRKASKIISSHLEKHINDYFGDHYEYSKKFVFLQHGITKDNLSTWFNSKKNLQCIITTTKPEYNSLVDKEGPYKLTKKEVVLTGFPRHDNLLANNCQDNNIILIMPTWRNNIVGEIVGTGSNTRIINKEFMRTEYAINWQKLLQSKQFEHLIKTYNYQVIFAPHANIDPYMSMFDIPSHIEVWQASTAVTSMQQLFQQSKLMITDYSSVAFEMGLLNKTVLYYQFDKDEMFSGAHTYQRGYFDYEKDGFGPVVSDELQLLIELKRILDNDGKVLDPYVKRIQDTFAYHDTDNCQRVYDAIIALDKPEEVELDVDMLYDMTLSAYSSQVWTLIESRSFLLIQHGNEEQREWAKSIFNEALYNQNKFLELYKAVESNIRVHDEKSYWHAKVAFATTNWQDAINLLESISILDNEPSLMLLYCYAETGHVDEFVKLKNYLKRVDLSLVESTVIELWSLRLYEQWEELLELLNIKMSYFSIQDLRNYQLQVLAAKAYRNLSKYTEAHQQLVDFESYAADNIKCRIEIAKLAFARDNYDKCISQYEKAVNNAINILPETAVYEYLSSHWNMGNIEALTELLSEFISLYPHNMDFKILNIRVLAEQSKWKALLEQASSLDEEYQADIIYYMTMARYRLGLIDEAYKKCIQPTNQHLYEYWNLIAEVALLAEDNELAKYCYRGMIAIYPSNNQLDNWSKFNSLKT